MADPIPELLVPGKGCRSLEAELPATRDWPEASGNDVEVIGAVEAMLEIVIAESPKKPVLTTFITPRTNSS